MKNKNIISYWNKYYSKEFTFNESSFARFILNYVKGTKKKSLVDIGCGNGRDSIFFFKKGFNVTGLDISKTAIKKNSLISNKNLSFYVFDIEKNTSSKKFDFIYSRFFIHALSETGENKFINLINKIKKKNTLIFLEFRNSKDEIFNKFKNKKHNNFINFGNGHYRRVIDTKKFISNFIKKTNSKIIYCKSSKNLSIVKKDNPNLSRLIFIL